MRLDFHGFVEGGIGLRKVLRGVFPFSVTSIKRHMEAWEASWGGGGMEGFLSSSPLTTSTGLDFGASNV